MSEPGHQPLAHFPAFTRERLIDIEPRETGYTVKSLLPRQGVAFMAGPSTTAKTFLAIETLLRVSRGEPVCGRRTRKAGVLYIAAEDADGVRKRLKAWTLNNGSQGAFELVPEAPDLRNPENYALLAQMIAQASADFAADGTPLGVIAFDTLSKSSPGADQNSSQDMGSVMAALERLAVRFNLLVVKRRPIGTPYRRAKGTPLALRYAVARRRSA